MKTIAIIPALNENDHLQKVIDGALRNVDQVVVIDDGSRSPLRLVIKESEKVHILRHIINLGKGAALKTGTVWAINHNFEVVVYIDADGQHDPQEIPKLLQPVVNGKADIVFGVREFGGRMPLVARFGNVFLTKAMKFLYKIYVEDTQSGFRSIKLSAFDKLSWTSSRYAVETEMIVNTGKHHVPYEQVPIRTIYHDKYKGTTVVDGIRIMINMLAWKIL